MECSLTREGHCLRLVVTIPLLFTVITPLSDNSRKYSAAMHGILGLMPNCFYYPKVIKHFEHFTFTLCYCIIAAFVIVWVFSYLSGRQNCLTLCNINENDKTVSLIKTWFQEKVTHNIDYTQDARLTGYRMYLWSIKTSTASVWGLMVSITRLLQLVSSEST